MIWLDRIIIAGIVALVVFTPLAIGSVNPWSFCTAEVVIFLLTIVWMARLALEQNPQTFPGLRSLLIPVASFISLVLFQLLPLPPALMHTLSPSTYALYATSLPGWPDRNPYPEPSPNDSRPSRVPQVGVGGHGSRQRPGAAGAQPRSPRVDFQRRIWRNFKLASDLYRS